jgi:uncharacterized protein involved in type VI secretion and phage assembly
VSCSCCVDGGGPRYFGLYPAIVTDLVDPENLGRVEVEMPWLGEGADGDVRAWATLVSPYAEDDQGFEFLPSVDTEVVIGFEAGNPRRPYLVGAAWNGREKLPEPPAAPNDKRLIRTRSGSLLEFDDTPGAVKVTLSTASGHRLVLDDGASSITVEHANGSAVTLNAAGQIEVRANATVEVTAAAVNVHAPAATFDGIVNCTTLIASSGVVSPAYTPGAGNVW